MRHILGLVVCSAVMAGCSPTSSGDDDGKDSSAPTEGGSPGGTTTAGAILFGEFSASVDNIVGTFDKTGGTVGGTSPCGQTTDGCMYCGPTVGGVKPGSFTFTTLSAGVLTVDDGSKKIATLDFNADAGGIYNAASVSPGWSPGDTLSVSATGDTIPAFSGSIVAPHEIEGETPSFSLLSPLKVSISTPLVIAWTPSSDGATMKLVLGNDANGNSGSVGCSLPESAGKFTISTALLTQVAMGMFTTSGGTISLTKTVTKALSVKGADVSLQASATQAAGAVTFAQ
jgi:hypothetical protein